MADQQSSSQKENQSITVTVDDDEVDANAQAGVKKVKLKSGFSTSEGPLNDVRILDMTRIVAGPYCSMILGDLGADVIKIEKPGVGDESRKWGPPYVNNTLETCYFVGLNRNKKSVTVNLKSEEGRDVILDLTKKCDVLIENYVPGSLNKLGLGYEDVEKVSPHLIYCSITGYGSRGPYKNKPGYDVIAASVGGLMSVTGPRDGPPCKVGVAMTDLATGLYAQGAILAALLARVKTGKGQKIDCNLLSTQLACLINIGSNYLNAGEEGEKWGSSHVSIVPYRSYKTSDNEYLTLGTGSDLQFVELCKKLGLPELGENESYKTNKDRVKNRDKLDDVIQSVLMQKTSKEWVQIFEGASFPFGPVNKISQAFDDKHVKSIGIVKEIDHPVAGKVKMVGPAVEFSNSKNDVYLPPPRLGEHTFEQNVSTVRLKLKKPRSGKKVNWTEETVDNENMDKKKSKCCCIYKKPKAPDESSSSDSDDECEHCQGHVEKKKAKQSSSAPPNPNVPSMIVA